MKREQVLHNARMAGRVKRYHVWPMLQEQTVGEHVFQCLRIWHQIWGPPPSHITCYFLWHDAGELVTGDLPFPVKSNNDMLKHIMDKMEEEAVEKMGVPIPTLSAYERIRVKACDLIEMHEHGNIELLMGNSFGQPIVEDTFAALEKLPLATEDSTLIFKYLSGMFQLFKEAYNGNGDLKNQRSS